MPHGVCTFDVLIQGNALQSPVFVKSATILTCQDIRCRGRRDGIGHSGVVTSVTHGTLRRTIIGMLLEVVLHCKIVRREASEREREGKLASKFVEIHVGTVMPPYTEISSIVS